MSDRPPLNRRIKELRDGISMYLNYGTRAEPTSGERARGEYLKLKKVLVILNTLGSITQGPQQRLLLKFAQQIHPPHLGNTYEPRKH